MIRAEKVTFGPLQAGAPTMHDRRLFDAARGAGSDYIEYLADQAETTAARERLTALARITPFREIDI